MDRKKRRAAMRKNSRARKKRLMTRYEKATLRWLIFCFPAGLLMMWSDRCRWKRASKCAVSLVVAALVCAILLPQTQPPARAKSGIEIVSNAPAVEKLGPVQRESDEDDYEVYLPTYVNPTSVVVIPTPSPEPIYVYYNQGGKYYHSRNCKYIKKTSELASLSACLNAGYTQCKECDAPSEDLAP
ncbi:MAG: hypothetical protein Q4D04_15080 [Clostridia bacterium]|nr:hypothetical protein [Clostridia bacterium]